MPAYYNPYMTVYPNYNPYTIPTTGSSNQFSYQPQSSPPVQVYTPLQQTPQQQNLPAGTFNWVKSEAEVDQAYVAPNSAATFWHSTEPIVYMKQTDVTGKPTVRTFDLVERVKVKEPEASKSAGSDYATKEELATFGNTVKSFSSVIKEMNEMMTNLKSELETMKGDMYGIAGKKKIVKKPEADGDE